MKRFISIICCVIFIGVASMSFAEEEESSVNRTKVAIEIIQLQSQLQLLNNLITNLAASAKNVEDRIAVLKENLKQLNIESEDTTKVLEESGLR